NRERGRELEFEEILGYHREQAYQYRTEIGVIDQKALDIAAQAAAKLGSAGRRASARGDATAAASLLSRAARVLPADSPARVEFLTEAAEASIEAGGFDAARAAIEEASTAAARLADARLEARAAMMAYLHSLASTGSAGELETTTSGLRSMIEVLERSGDLAGL